MQLAAANPVRLLALVAVAAAVGGGMLVLKSTQGGSSSGTSAPKLLHASVGPALAHKHRPGVLKTAPQTTKSTRPRTHVTPRPVHKPAPVHRAAVAPNGLPWSVADALKRSPVVVLAVVSPNSSVDELALAEAKAGAKAGKAGFVEVDAYRQSQIGPLASTITVSSNPAILVLRRPDQVTLQVAGFADRATVAQAVDDARITAG